MQQFVPSLSFNFASQSAPTKNRAQANAAIAAAKEVNKKAKAVFFERRDSGKLIKKAKKASKSYKTEFLKNI